MRRKKNNFISALTGYAPTAGGVILGEIVGARIPIQNQMAKDGLPAIAGALIAANSKNKMLQDIGAGMAIGGIANMASNVLPGITGYSYTGGPVNGANYSYPVANVPGETYTGQY